MAPFLIYREEYTVYMINPDKSCIRCLTGLEKLPGAVLWDVGRCSNEEPLCQFIGNSMVRFVDY